MGRNPNNLILCTQDQLPKIQTVSTMIPLITEQEQEPWTVMKIPTHIYSTTSLPSISGG